MNEHPPCDTDVYKNGHCLFIADTSGCGSGAFESWISDLRLVSGFKVDWHYVGGRAVVKFIAKGDAIEDALKLQDVIIAMHRENPARVMQWIE